MLERNEETNKRNFEESNEINVVENCKLDEERLDNQRARVVTPFRIIQILLKTTNGFLPGVQPLHHLSMSSSLSSEPSVAADCPEVIVDRGSPDRTSSAYESNMGSNTFSTATLPNSSAAMLEEQVSPPGSTSPGQRRLKQRPSPPRLKRQTTLALLTVDEDELRIATSSNGKRQDPPPPYSSVAEPSSTASTSTASTSTSATLPTVSVEGRRLFAAEKGLDVLSHELESNDCVHWPWFLQHRPILRLVLVMAFNGLVSMACAAIFIELERPQQLQRMHDQAELQTELKMLRRKLVTLLGGRLWEPQWLTRSMFANYSSKLVTVSSVPEEIQWEMLAASAFVTSVSSTTGYGDIVPVTRAGKIFTLVYALYGIPVFLWYIVKLGALFRVLIMRPVTSFLNFMRSSVNPRAARMQRQLTNVFVARPRQPQVHSDITTELLMDDKRFHPSVIGVLLLVFLLAIALLITNIESISYFDSFYAAFITYSTIGFGDIDIYRISYRADWFSMLIYGNGLSIVGYTLVSAWVASILNSCGIRKKH